MSKNTAALLMIVDGALCLVGIPFAKAGGDWYLAVTGATLVATGVALWRLA